MNLLVAGAARVDAGKTTFSTGLLARVDGVGFKPRAGNDHWHDHGDVRRAVAEGRLYGKDARRLAAASEGDHDPEAINPVHRLWRPSPAGGTGVLGREDRAFLVDRVGDDYVVNGTVDLPETVRDGLPVGGATVVEDLEAANRVMADRHVPAVERLAEVVAAADRAVVESYADVAVPLAGVAYDAVAVVEPRRARVYDGERFERACEVASGSPRRGRLETTVEDVLGLLEPAASTPLPALGAEERRDPAAVADAYGAAYDAVLATAAD
jgi:predicted P-loop ATPase/GTPase